MKGYGGMEYGEKLILTVHMHARLHVYGDKNAFS